MAGAGRRHRLIGAIAALTTACSELPPVAATEPGPPLRLESGATRLDLRFACGETECAGWLYLPASAALAPVVVMGSGFAGTRDVALPWFAERFAAAGIAAFVFDYRHFGASGGSPRQLLNPWQQIDDWRDAIAFVRTRDDVDGARVALWGSSMGGGHALIAGARDRRVRAVFAQAPVVDTSVQGDTVYFGAPWLARVVLTAWADLFVEFLGHGPVTIPAIAPTGGFGMIVGDDFYADFQRLVDPGSTFRNWIAAHSVFTFDGYDPAIEAAPLGMPVLLAASRTDRIVPFVAVERFAVAHPKVRVETFEGDHFDVYLPPARERTAELATAFLAERLAPVAATSP
jgi:pimeloyl-ACP methyl ester carboxylesterase